MKKVLLPRGQVAFIKISSAHNNINLLTAAVLGIRASIPLASTDLSAYSTKHFTKETKFYILSLFICMEAKENIILCRFLL